MTKAETTSGLLKVMSEACNLSVQIYYKKNLKGSQCT